MLFRSRTAYGDCGSYCCDHTAGSKKAGPKDKGDGYCGYHSCAVSRTDKKKYKISKENGINSYIFALNLLTDYFIVKEKEWGGRVMLKDKMLWMKDSGNIRPEEILKRTKTDPHSLGKWRVDGALPQIGAWYEAFNITEKDPMYLPVDKRVSIW